MEQEWDLPMILATIVEVSYLYVLGVHTIHELSEKTEKTRLAAILVKSTSTPRA